VTEQGLTSPLTQLRLSGRQFYRSMKKTQSTVSKYRRKTKIHKKRKKTINTYTCKNTQNPVYTNTMGWLGAVSHRGQAAERRCGCRCGTPNNQY